MKKNGFMFIMILLVLSLSACSSSKNASSMPKQSEQASTTAPGATPSTTETPTPSTTETPTGSPAPATSQTPIFNPPVHFDYPDAVRGIYVTGWSAGGERMQKLIKLLDDTDLNAMVIDIKDDDGFITFKPEGKLAEFGQPYIKDPKALMKTLEEHKIYPIARIVAFKDTVLAQKRPDLSYVQGDSVWRNGNGDGFINPFLKETWDHNLDAAKLAVELGFKEIQFDYVRFPEGFESRDKVLKYSMGDYKDKKPTKFVQEEQNFTDATKKYQAPDFSDKERMTQLRVDAVSDFVAYAKDQLKPYGVKVSVDIFGYSATLPEAPGIGQNFGRISNSVDVISSMIYPSHWSDGYFGISKPDKEPYKLVAEYAKREKEKFAELQTPPTSRPWIQDFTASWLGSGNYLKYGKAEVDAQIKALKDSGINEYLIWNANNSYTEGITYKP